MLAYSRTHKTACSKFLLRFKYRVKQYTTERSDQAASYKVSSAFSWFQYTLERAWYLPGQNDQSVLGSNASFLYTNETWTLCRRHIKWLDSLNLPHLCHVWNIVWLDRDSQHKGIFKIWNSRYMKLLNQAQRSWFELVVNTEDSCMSICISVCFLLFVPAMELQSRWNPTVMLHCYLC